MRLKRNKTRISNTYGTHAKKGTMCSGIENSQFYLLFLKIAYLVAFFLKKKSHSTFFLPKVSETNLFFVMALCTFFKIMRDFGKI